MKRDRTPLTLRPAVLAVVVLVSLVPGICCADAIARRKHYGNYDALDPLFDDSRQWKEAFIYLGLAAGLFLISAATNHHSRPDPERQAMREAVKQLSDPDPAVADAAVPKVAHYGAMAVKACGALLNHEHVVVRNRAVAVLSQIGDCRAVRPLTRALRDADPLVRAAAAEALIGRAAQESAEALARRALHDEDVEVRVRAIEALATIEGARPVSALKRVVDEDPNSEVRAAAAAVLSGLDAEFSTPRVGEHVARDAD